MYLFVRKEAGGFEVILKTFNDANVCEIVDTETMKLDYLVFRFLQGLLSLASSLLPENSASDRYRTDEDTIFFDQNLKRKLVD